MTEIMVAFNTFLVANLFKFLNFDYSSLFRNSNLGIRIYNKFLIFVSTLQLEKVV